jgi:sensor histidine kinase YesM
MEQKRMNEIIHSVLVNSTQLAFVEEAYGTLALLENTNEVFRYFSGDMQSVTLFNELEVFESYLSVQKVRYGDRFSVDISNEPKYKSIFIPRMSIIDFFDSVIIKLLERNEISIEIKIDIETDRDKNKLSVIISMGSKEYGCKEIDCL